MSKRLVKIAKELNVGTLTIVKYLTEVGFEVDNKPTAKISDEMYVELTQQFSKSIEVKERADKLIMGAAKKPEAPAVVVTKPIEKPEKIVREAPKEEVIVREKQEVKVTMVGKVDLSPKVKTKATIEEKVEEPVAEEIKKTTDSEGVKAPEEEVMLRAETPQLKGLKVMGKIDSDKLKKPKPKEKPAPAKPNPSKGENEAKKRRKRRRKKVTVQNSSQGQRPGHQHGGDRRNQRSGGHREEVKQVSQKK